MMRRQGGPPAVGCNRVVGIDPAGPGSWWGIAVLEKSRSSWRARAWRLRGSEALSVIAKLARGSCAVCIDAPTSPPGEGEAFRPQERILLRLGGRLLPLTLGSMKALTRVGVALAYLLAEAGYRVLETHPGSIRRLLGVPAAPRGVGRHEADALLAAYACAAAVKGTVLELCSRKGKGCIVVPAAPLVEGL